MLFATMEPAKYAFQMINRIFMLAPYLTGLANDISLGQATHFNKISERCICRKFVFILVWTSSYDKLATQQKTSESFQMNSL
jgi:hypothetical protein